MTTTQKISYGTWVTVTVTNLKSLASSATAGWRGALVDNTATGADDYEISVTLPTANTAPANDKQAYLYISKGITSDTSVTWVLDDQGTTTLPTTSEGTTTIAVPNSLAGPGVLSYTTQQMTMQRNFFLSSLVGNKSIMDSWTPIIINFTGAALTSLTIVSYRPITYTNG